MSIDLDYLRSELQQLKNEYGYQKNEIEDRVEREVQEFKKNHNLDESDKTNASILKEYRDLKMRIYARELESKEELLTSVKNKLEQLEKIYSD